MEKLAGLSLTFQVARYMGVVHVGEELYSKVASTFHSIFLLFLMKVAGAPAHSSRLLVTALSQSIGLRGHYMHLLSTAGLEKKSRRVIQDKQIFFWGK